MKQETFDEKKANRETIRENKQNMICANSLEYLYQRKMTYKDTNLTWQAYEENWEKTGNQRERYRKTSEKRA